MKKILLVILVAFILPMVTKAQIFGSGGLFVSYTSQSGGGTVLATVANSNYYSYPYTIADGGSHSFVATPPPNGTASWWSLSFSISYPAQSATGLWPVSIPYTTLNAQTVGVPYPYYTKIANGVLVGRYSVTKVSDNAYSVILLSVPVCCPW